MFFFFVCVQNVDQKIFSGSKLDVDSILKRSVFKIKLLEKVEEKSRKNDKIYETMISDKIDFIFLQYTSLNNY